MIKLSNKGQSLLTFVVFIPFLIILGVWIIDITNMKYSENKLKELNKEVVNYGINHIENDPYDSMVEIIRLNDNDVIYQIDIDTENQKVNVILEKDINGILTSIVGIKNFKIKNEYKASIKDEKIIIEEGAK